MEGVGGHHHDHAHGVDTEADRTRLLIALGLILALMAGEVVAGILAESLALLSDAAHMLTDAGALVLSLVAIRLAARPAKGAMTYGFAPRSRSSARRRTGSRCSSSAAFIVYEAIRRLVSPPDVEGAVVLAIALRRDRGERRRHARPCRGESPAASTSRAASSTSSPTSTRSSGRRSPASSCDDRVRPRGRDRLARRRGADVPRRLRAAPRVGPGVPGGRARGDRSRGDRQRDLAAQPHVVEVHDLHVWEVTSGFPALSAHISSSATPTAMRSAASCATAARAVRHLEHTTLQVDHEEREQELIPAIEDRRDTV